MQALTLSSRDRSPHRLAIQRELLIPRPAGAGHRISRRGRRGWLKGSEKLLGLLLQLFDLDGARENPPIGAVMRHPFPPQAQRRLERLGSFADPLGDLHRRIGPAQLGHDDQD